MSIDSEKLKNFRADRKLSQAQLAQIIGVTQASVAMIEKDTRPVTANFKLAFQKAFGLDWDSQTASGDSYSYENLNKFYENIIPIPFYSAKAAAGIGETLPDYPEADVIYFDKRWLKNIIGVKPEHASIIQAVGDSMDGGNNPIKNGDLLLIDGSVKDVINEKIFVIQLNKSELVVKRVVKEWDGTVKLISNNSKYKDRILKEGEQAEIIGRVVWNVSKENV